MVLANDCIAPLGQWLPEPVQRLPQTPHGDAKQYYFAPEHGDSGPIDFPAAAANRFQASLNVADTITPPPAGRLSARTLPPWNSAMRRAMYRPRPRWGPAPRSFLTETMDSNSVPRISSGSGGPWFSTETRAILLSFVPSRSTLMTMAAPGAEKSTALAASLSSSCAASSGAPTPSLSPVGRPSSTAWPG